jgi:putative cell wall-binding protein/Tol biopolymer transport system component
MRAWGRGLLSAVVVLGVLVSGAQAGSATPTPIGATGVVRLAGQDRYATAAAISRATWAPPVPVVYVTTGLDFPDALAGGPAAARSGGPVLPVQATTVPAVIAAELDRLDPERIVILGGTGAVSGGMQVTLAAYAPSVARLAGADRYATAASIATSVFAAPVPVAYVASGAGFADAAAGGAAAAHEGGPMLLTTPTALPASTAAALTALRPSRIVVVGGTGAVSAAVQTALAGLASASVTRLGGTDRFDTARVLAQEVFGTSESIALATGLNFPDALAGVPTAFVNDAPLLLTWPSCAAWPAHVAWITLGATRSITLGGTAVVSDKAAHLIGCIHRVAAVGIAVQGEAVLPDLSADGRYVSFYSEASTLVPEDTNGNADVFLGDTLTGTITRVSTASDGTQASGSTPALSDDGRYVAFTSDAWNLVPGDTNGAFDVFRKDTVTGQTIRVSTASNGAQAGSDGFGLAISANGRYVAFTSEVSGLVPGDTNGVTDVFVKDTQTGATTRVSTASNGGQATDWSSSPVISADGRHVALVSAATNLVPGDTNGMFDVFVKDTQTGTTTRVSTASNGAEADGYSNSRLAISADGRFVAFESGATNLVPGGTGSESFGVAQPGSWGVYIKDTQTGTTTRVCSDCNAPALSTDGRYVTFHSGDVFVTDTDTGQTVRVSVAADGAQATARSWGATVSGDGRYVAFLSDAADLVPGDTDQLADVFLVQLR